MSWTADPLPEDAPAEVRAAQCEASYGNARARRAVLGEERLLEDDVPMRSAKVRRLLAGGVRRLGRKPGARVDLGEIHFAGSGSDNAAYGAALLNDSARVALALEVGDSQLTLERRADGDVDARWSGVLHYPGTDIAFAAPVPWIGGEILRVSETVFCGMHVDGAMNPFRLTYRWTLREDDPRLHAERERSELGVLERLARSFLLAVR
jgi:hypothetical protein